MTDAPSKCGPSFLGGIAAKLDGTRFGCTHERLTYVGAARSGRRPEKSPALLFDHAQHQTSGLITRTSFRALRYQMKIGQKVHGEISPHLDVAVTAVPADSGDLDRALIEVHVVGLIRHGGGMRTSDGNVDRSIDRYADIDEGA